MIELHSPADLILSDGDGRTPLARETLCVAFMLLAFHDAGAVCDPQILLWAQKTLWQNNELTPRQLAAQFPGAAA